MVVFVFLILSLIWGSTWLFIKIGLEDLPPFWFASGRFIMASVPLLLLTWVKRKAIPRNRADWMLIAITGFLIFSSNYALVFWAELYISSGLAAILYTSLPLFGMGITHFYRRMEVFSMHKLMGILAGIFGVALIFRDQLNLHDPMVIWGSLAILLASFGTAFGSVLIKAHGTHIDIVIMTTGQILIGLVPLTALALFLEPMPVLQQIPTRAWLGMAYLGLLGSAFTFVLNNWLIKQIPVTTTQLIPFASTLLAVWLGVSILDEPLHVGTIIGGVLVLAGLLIATKQAKPVPRLLSHQSIEDAGRCPNQINQPGENHAVEAEAGL